MKLLTLFLGVFFINTLFISHVQAGKRETQGVIIGAGSGAAVGQAIGRDTESTLAGAAIGGAIGYIVGHNMNDGGEKRVVDHRNRYSPAIIEHRRSTTYKRVNSHDHRVYKKRSKVCRKTVKFKKHKGKHTRIVKTTCEKYTPRYKKYKNDRHKQYDRRYDRKSWQYDQRYAHR